MAQDYTQVNFRIPTSLKEKIESSALENNRSITSELVSRLEQSFEPRSVIHAEDPETLKSVVAYSIKSVLDELKNEGVEQQKISKALNRVINKK